MQQPDSSQAGPLYYFQSLFVIKSPEQMRPVCENLQTVIIISRIVVNTKVQMLTNMPTHPKQLHHLPQNEHKLAPRFTKFMQNIVLKKKVNLSVTMSTFGSLKLEEQKNGSGDFSVMSRQQWLRKPTRRRSGLLFVYHAKMDSQKSTTPEVKQGEYEHRQFIPQ